MKGLGKTPSLYNGRRQVVGIPKWTQKVATAEEVEAWSREPDHGICIQTRLVRGLDIDVEDAELAAAFAAPAGELAASEKEITAELLGVQGSPADIGGYYLADTEKVTAVMRPSATFNAALDAVRG